MKPGRIRITIKLFNEFKRYGPSGGGPVSLEMANGATVGHAREKMGIPADTPRMVLQNGRATTENTPLVPGASLAIFAPVSGG